MHVQHREEDSDAPPGHAAEAELGRGNRGRHGDHGAIRRRDHRANTARRHALGVAEEVEAQHHEEQPKPGQPSCSEHQAEREHHQPAENEGPAGRMRRGEHETKRVGEGHGFSLYP